MIPIDVFPLFIAASAALAISPGPDNIFVLTQSAMNGRKAGIIITFGLCTGLLVHITAVTMGVAAILKTSAVAFTLLKMAGALYLLYLAWHAFRAGDTRLTNGGRNPTGTRALYMRGILMNLSNPKVAIFFLAFLPQFANPDRGLVSIQIIELGIVFMITSLIIFIGIAWAAAHIGNWLMRSRRAQRGLHRFAGVVFILLAFRLAISKQ